MKDSELGQIKSKLEKFETQLKSLLEGVEEDLSIARDLQKFLMPNRLPDVPGMKCLARYISAQQLSSDGFDVIPSKKGQELWFVASWTERFGLSSILLQALVHLQSRALVDSNTHLSVEQVFNDLSVSLASSKRAGHYRLMVARIDMLSLKVSGFSQGSFPLIRRRREKNQLGAWQFIDGSESLEKSPALLLPASSEAPVLADRAHAFSFTAAPGSRFYYLSSDWSTAHKLDAFLEPLELKAEGNEKSELVADLNHLLIKAEDHLKASHREADVLGVCFEVDAGKLHLA